MLGTAYGLMQSVQNLGLAVMYVFLLFDEYWLNVLLVQHRNIFTGLILDQYGYFMLEIFFIVCLEIALLATAFLYIYNSLKKGMLNDSAVVRHAKQEEQELTKKPESCPVLKGQFAGLRKYRIGDYRVIYALVGTDILVLRIGNRRDVYKGQI